MGIEVADGRIRARGAAWTWSLHRRSAGSAVQAPKRLLVTAVDRVATITGSGHSARAPCRAPGLPLLAAGGIRSLADLEAVRDAGAAGAVVGRSALEGSLDLAAALGWSAA